MRTITLAILLITCFLSCAEKLMEPPENLIERDKMVLILEDLAKLNAARTTNVTILHNYEIEPMDYIFSKYGIDSIQFVESDLYYASLPQEYQTIYEDIEKRLSAAEELIKEQKKISDSLKQKEREAKRKKDSAKDSLQ